MIALERRRQPSRAWTFAAPLAAVVLTMVLGGATVVLGALVIALSVRLRAGELRTLERIGASRGVAVRLVTIELGLILVAATALVAGGLVAVRLWFPDLMELIP